MANPTSDRTTLCTLTMFTNNLLRLAFYGIVFCSLISASTCSAEETEQEISAEEVISETVGIELGEFFIRDVRGSEGVKTRVSFTLYADVPLDRETSFRALQQQYEQRIRDQVILAIRLCQTSQFQEPTLHSLKRRIGVRLRRMIPGFQAEGLMFKDFAYFND